MSKKNRKSKILLSTTLTASAFISTMNVDATQNTSADKWVKEAENLAGALKWAISVEGKEGEVPEIPWTLYNQTKQAKEKALEAIKSLPKKERTIYETRLQNNVDLYISTTSGKVGRVVAYIDAITAGKKIAENEYCGLNEPAMRSFEPLFADNRASECGEKSHCLFRGTAIEMVFS